jgi:uncharacterized repeat protein (TIGR03837 family)
MGEPGHYCLLCRVVDHYGDAGFALRLARQLAAEHGIRPTLWIDDLATLARIASGIDARRDDQVHAGIRVRRLVDAAASREDLGDARAVVELFGAGLPASWIDALGATARPPPWIVLEYLTAEAWADGAHGRPSPHPALAIPRWFFVPGFSDMTGGLLREQGLLAARDRFRGDPDARQAMWRDLGLAPPSASTLVVSLFCYPNPALVALFEAWSEGERELLCVVPQGVAEGALDRFLAGDVPHPGRPRRRGALELAAVPFVDQAAFDRRLWASDLSIVRGEDSFVRAQWAARPFAWHIYPQQEGADRVKLDAFLGRCLEGVAREDAEAIRAFWHALNDADGPALARSWPPFQRAMPGFGHHLGTWATRLAAQRDLATQLVEFVRDKL